MAIAVFGLILAVVPFLWPDLPAGLKFCIVVPGLTALAYVVSGEPTPGRIRLFRWVAALEAVAVLAYGLGQIPTRGERAASAFFAECETANIWVDMNPVIYSASQDYLADHWDEVQPLEKHAWDLQVDAESVSARNVVDSGGVVQGRLVEFAGQVQALQDYGGGEIVYQLLIPSKALAMDDPGLVRHVPDAALRLNMTYLNSSDPERRIVYVRMTPRPFFMPPPNSILIVKGVVVGYGRTLRMDSKISDVGYVAGSAAEWFRAAEPED